MSKKRTTDRPAVTAPLYATVRQGDHEFAQGLPALPTSIRIVEEPGTLGNPTPQMITEEMGTLKDYNRLLDRYSSRGQERNGPEQGMER